VIRPFFGNIGNAHARCHVTGWQVVIQNHIFGIIDPNLATHYIITTIEGSLHGSTPIVNRFSVENNPVKIGPKMAVFRELRGVNVKFLFSNPEKAHPCAKPRRLTYNT